MAGPPLDAGRVRCGLDRARDALQVAADRTAITGVVTIT
jgi:hypothetical protein